MSSDERPTVKEGDLTQNDVAKSCPFCKPVVLNSGSNFQSLRGAGEMQSEIKFRSFAFS